MRSLVFTIGSPFARAVRVLLDELGLEYERHEHTSAPRLGEHEGAAPTLQVPVLRDGETVLWESGLIAEFLLSRYASLSGVRPDLADTLARDAPPWEDRLIFSAVQTLGTAATTISQMKWSGVDHDKNEFLSRSADRIDHLMDWLEEQLPDTDSGFYGEGICAQDIFLTCHLGFVANWPLGIDLKPESHPRVSALIQRLEARTSFLANPVLWWEPGVTGYSGDGKPLFS